MAHLWRNPITGAAAIAPKLVFTVFRVPLMNLTHGLMAAVMLSRTTDFEDEGRRSSYFGFLRLFAAGTFRFLGRSCGSPCATNSYWPACLFRT
jgi:hypothetical protein